MNHRDDGSKKTEQQAKRGVRSDPQESEAVRSNMRAGRCHEASNESADRRADVSTSGGAGSREIVHSQQRVYRAGGDAIVSNARISCRRVERGFNSIV